MLAVAMETTILSSQLRSLTTPSLFSLRAYLSPVSLASPLRCALRATSWNNGQSCLVPERKRGATLRVRAGEQAAAGDGDEEKEPVDYRLYQALMRGGEEVASVLSEMTELVSASTGFLSSHLPSGRVICQHKEDQFSLISDHCTSTTLCASLRMLTLHFQLITNFSSSGGLSEKECCI